MPESEPLPRDAELSAGVIEGLGYAFPLQLGDGTWVALGPLTLARCGLFTIVDVHSWGRYYTYQSCR